MFRPHFPELLSCDCSYFADFLFGYADLYFEADKSFSDSSSNLIGDEIVTGSVFTKTDCVVSGVDCVVAVFNKYSDVKCEVVLSNGSECKVGEKILKLSGKKIEIVRLERFVLNLMSRMCGIATHAFDLVKAMSVFENDVQILSTRKGVLSLLDKKAACDGGTLSHRLNLKHGLMIKDNHLEGRSISELISGIVIDPSVSFVEIEVENESGALEAYNVLNSLDLKVGKGILFDNFDPLKLTALLSKHRFDRVFTEASGGITKDNISEFDIEGLDYVSSGAITQNPYAIDLSLEVDKK